MTSDHTSLIINYGTDNNFKAMLWSDLFEYHKNDFSPLHLNYRDHDIKIHGNLVFIRGALRNELRDGKR